MEINRRKWLKGLLGGAAGMVAAGKVEESKGSAVGASAQESQTIIKEVVKKDQMTVSEVDEILKDKGLDPLTRMHLKNDLLAYGRMELGVVRETWAVGPSSGFNPRLFMFGPQQYTFSSKLAAEKFKKELAISRDPAT